MIKKVITLDQFAGQIRPTIRRTLQGLGILQEDTNKPSPYGIGRVDVCIDIFDSRPNVVRLTIEASEFCVKANSEMQFMEPVAAGIVEDALPICIAGAAETADIFAERVKARKNFQQAVAGVAQGVN